MFLGFPTDLPGVANRFAVSRGGTVREITRSCFDHRPLLRSARRRDEYSVTISSQKLGMTVENMLERTVVRAAAPGGGAEAAGVETGSLLVALDGQTTKVASKPASPLFVFWRL